VEGCEPPAGAAKVLLVRIGVDPRYTLETHKSTGYYKVSRACGIAGRSVTTARRPRWRIGWILRAST